MKKKKVVLFTCLFLFLALIVLGVWYVQDYYHAKEDALNYLTDTEQVTVKKISDGLWFEGRENQTALIFYPGAKVEYTAYAPLMYHLALEGIDCFLVSMPCNLAIFGQNKANNILSNYSYKKWYLGGHSLGGAMAASYASKNGEKLDGLLLLAAYPVKSLKDQDLSVLTIYGDQDQVCNRKKLEAGREFMPANYTEICIEGGNHAQFGDYGKQKKDGEATISKEEQQRQTIEAILKVFDS